MRSADIVRICPLARETAEKKTRNDDNDVAARCFPPDGKAVSKTLSNNTVHTLSAAQMKSGA